MIDEHRLGRRVPNLGSEVRSEDGTSFGRVDALDKDSFVVVKGRRRIRRTVIPYSSIAALGNRTVLLKTGGTKFEKREAAGVRREAVSKKLFLTELDERLEFDNLERTERIVRTALYIMGSRLPRERKKKLSKVLPSGVRKIWMSVDQSDEESSFDMSDFLLPIKKQGRLQSMEEAFIAAREVFSSIKRMIPATEMTDITHSIPRGIQEIWESAS